MNALEAIVYGVLQGLTEFLPVSSSAHLILLPWLLGWQDPGLAFDVALHFGTLLALLAYFWRDWWELGRKALANWRGFEARLLAILALGTLPGGLAGLFLEKRAETLFRQPALIAAASILFALWLGWADRRGAKKLGLDSMTFARGLRIGLAQALAIIPGVSRSGVTITVGLMEGMTAEAATRFSFLLATPIILGAALHELPHLGHSAFNQSLALGVICSTFSGIWALKLLLALSRSWNFRPFVYYRLVFGLLILVLGWLK